MDKTIIASKMFSYCVLVVNFTLNPFIKGGFNARKKRVT